MKSLKRWLNNFRFPRRSVFDAATGRWNYDGFEQAPYGDDTTYRKGIEFLDGYGNIEDWGCGTAYAKRFVTQSAYRGIDWSKSRWTDTVADLRNYSSSTDCIFMRHVLECTYDWEKVLGNAVSSLRKRMVLIISTPFSETTYVIRSWGGTPEISFRRDDITRFFTDMQYREETLETKTVYEAECIFYIQK